METPETAPAPKVTRLAFGYDVANDAVNIAYRLETEGGGNVHVNLLKVGEELSVAEIKAKVRTALQDVLDAI